MIALLLVSQALRAQVKFSATISPATLGKDEVAELKLMVENAGNVEQITPPGFSNFIVISGPNQESGMESINGSVRRYTGLTYLLKPKATGEYTIRAATARADGKTYTSNTVTVKVVKDATGNSANRNSPFSNMMPFDEPQEQSGYGDFIIKKGENVQDKISKNLFVRVDADKTSCYVGEPIVVTYKLYTRLKSESNIVKNPSFNGFSVIDLVPPQASINYVVEKFEGREYNVYTLRKVQLYPLQPGRFDLETASIENNVHFIKGEYLQHAATDIFGEFIPGTVPKDAMLDQRVTIQSKPVEINVKPLPDTGKPASFSGAVGNFSIDAALDKDSVTTDDAGLLKVKLSGQGNFTLVPAPEVRWPEGLQGYDPRVKEGLNKVSVPVSGDKIIDYPFTFDSAGTYTIPPVNFSFFDVAAARYKTVSTKPLSILVKKGTGKRKPVIPADQRGRRESFFDMIFTNRWMIIVPVALLIIAGLGWWLWWDRKKAAGKPVEASEPAPEQVTPELPEQPLLQTERMLMNNDSARFFTTLNQELHDYLGARLGLAPADMSKRNIAEALDQSGISVADSFAVQRLLDEISVQLYTPLVHENRMQDMYVEALRIVNLFQHTPGGSV